jgi:hypothetical protein
MPLPAEHEAKRGPHSGGNEEEVKREVKLR